MSPLNLLKLALLGAFSVLSGCTATIPVGTALQDGAVVKAPAGWVAFCGRTPADPSCRSRPLDTLGWNQLQATQAHIRKMRYVSDKQQFDRTEYWQVAQSKGDCEDMALAARKLLLDYGWPASVVRLATVFTEERQVHSVLTVEVTRANRRQTLVLDSRFPMVMTSDQLADIGYQFVIRQSAIGADWVSIGNSP